LPAAGAVGGAGCPGTHVVRRSLSAVQGSVVPHPTPALLHTPTPGCCHASSKAQMSLAEYRVAADE
jgi:hypothetical protein